MTDQTPRPGNAPGTPEERLKLFAEWTKTTPPDRIITDYRTFADELLTYADANGLSLDWLWLGDPASLIMEAHQAAKRNPRAIRRPTMDSAWSDRYNDTDAALADLEGVLTVLSAAAYDSELLTNPADGDPLGHGILAMLRVLDDMVMPRVREARKAEWLAAVPHARESAPGPLVSAPIVGATG